MRIIRFLVIALAVLATHFTILAGPPRKPVATADWVPYDASKSTLAYQVLTNIAQGGITLVDFSSSGRSMATREGQIAGGCAPSYMPHQEGRVVAQLRALANIAAAREGSLVSGREIASDESFRTSATGASSALVGPTRVIYSDVMLYKGSLRTCVLVLESPAADG